MLVTADQLVAHAVGDYVLQSDWMANEKTKKSVAALAHVATYFLPFLFLTQSWKALAVIVVTHFFIDRFRLARFVCYVKNFLSPPYTRSKVIKPGDVVPGIEINRWWFPWTECAGTGYPNTRPAWLAVWLLIIADNTLHVVCNALAIKYL